MYASQGSYDSLEDSVEKQIRAFADSIDQNKADGNAATALAKHGISGNGKTLKVGKSHALTATIFNSEMFQVALAESCAAAIKSMQILDLSILPYSGGNYSWYGADGSFYESFTLHKEDETIDYFLVGPSVKYTGKRNAYDDSLDWMVANTRIRFEIKRVKITGTDATYSVTCKVYDRFDFSTSSNSGFKQLLSGIGAVLFKEFDWEATATFNLTVPYSCTHSSGIYRWTYDANNNGLTSDDSDGYTLNDATRYSFTDSEGTTSYYYELDETLRLYHNKPWVMEYDIKKPGKFVLTAFEIAPASRPTTMPCLYNSGRNFLFVSNREYIKHEGGRRSISNYYGTALKSLFTYDVKTIYTFRLENEIHSDGSNMIYLTVSNNATEEILLDKVPMDDYYRYESWVGKTVYQNDENDWVSGKDLFINYIGNQAYPFSADHFELRIWENGIEGENGDYLTTKITKPTCTKQGYTTYTCSCCGYSYQADKVKANGHSYGDWSVVTAPTCTEVGEEQRTCKTCKEVETQEIAATGHSYEPVVKAPTCLESGYTTFTCACGDSYVGDDTEPLGHSFEDHICTACGEMEYALGDVDLNGAVDVDDVLALLWNVLFPEEYPIEVPADFDGSGTTDVDDVLALLWRVLFPEEYPLN